MNAVIVNACGGNVDDEEFDQDFDDLAAGLSGGSEQR